MSDVELVATRDFSYSTRRLKAGESFLAPARDARVLIAIRKAEEPRKAGRIAPPPADVLERAAAVAPRPAAHPLDRDGDGHKGGSRKGSARRKRAAKKG